MSVYVVRLSVILLMLPYVIQVSDESVIYWWYGLPYDPTLV